MLVKCFALPLLVTILLPSFAVTQDFVRLIPVITKLETKANSKFGNVTNIIHHANTVTNQTIEFQILISRVIKDLKATLTYYIVTVGNVKNALITRSVDVCSFIRRPTMDRFLKTIYDNVNRHSMLPSKCPLQPGNYCMRNVQPAALRIPAFVPETEFVIATNYWTGPQQEPVVNSLVFGKLIRHFEKLPSIK